MGSSRRKQGNIPFRFADDPAVEVHVLILQVDYGIVFYGNVMDERYGTGGLGVVGNRTAEVGTRCKCIDYVDPDIVHVHPVPFQSPVHQGELHVYRIPGVSLEAARGHAENVPLRGVGYVVFHEVRVEIRCFLGVQVQVNPPGRTIGFNAGFDA